METSSDINLHDLLKSDFGIDFPISGGNGTALTEPIFVHVESASEASRVQMEVTRCICSRLGLHWRVVEKNLLEQPDKMIEKVKLETIHPEGDQIITEFSNRYFDLSNVNLESGEGTPPCGFFLGEAFGFGLPFEFGWLHHYGTLINNEEHTPGFGVSVGYGAPFTKATIYVYNKELPKIDYRATPDVFLSEFDGAVNDLFSAYPNAKLLNENRRDNGLFKAFEIGTAYSVIMLSTFNNHFFKTRLTMDGSTDSYVFDCMMQSLSRIGAATTAN